LPAASSVSRTIRRVETVFVELVDNEASELLVVAKLHGGLIGAPSKLHFLTTESGAGAGAGAETAQPAKGRRSSARCFTCSYTEVGDPRFPHFGEVRLPACA
jgi:hypothetical protein